MPLDDPAAIAAANEAIKLDILSYRGFGNYLPRIGDISSILDNTESVLGHSLSAKIGDKMTEIARHLDITTSSDNALPLVFAAKQSE